MKTKFILPIWAFFTLLLSTSCEKCMTCQYTYDRYERGMWDNVSHTEEFCGTTKEVEAKEQEFMDEAAETDHRNQSAPSCWYD
ncbi:MAG: hypothetical protein ACFB10_18670 [Salibacteraceae bacterium]